MIKISQLLRPESVQFQIEANSKKSLLELLSISFTDILPQYDEHQLFDTFLQRERLGSTAIGQGVAIPHARIPGNMETIASFISLKNAINFDASDEQDVNLFFALVIPESSTQEHLSILATLARFFREEKNRQKILGANSSEDIYQILCRIN
ncbi:MAG: PTS sugar transporter subunit IIA [Gammaproteobacteria bacterium]|nr:PTS sugar transporter subunit IIA [Gammaproteobacteria bacterium]